MSIIDTFDFYGEEIIRERVLLAAMEAAIRL